MSDDEFNHKMIILQDAEYEAMAWEDRRAIERIQQEETKLLAQYNTEAIDDWRKK